MGSGDAVTMGGGLEENVSLPAALNAARYPDPLSTNEGTTDERANDRASVTGFTNETKAEL